MKFKHKEDFTYARGLVRPDAGLTPYKRPARFTHPSIRMGAYNPLTRVVNTPVIASDAVGRSEAESLATPRDLTPPDFSELLLFAPLGILVGLGKKPPKWMEAALFFGSVGTLAVNIKRLVDIKKQQAFN